jgi:hypothetical protein
MWPPSTVAPDAGTMDKILVTGIAHLFWDIRRYNRAKTSLINSATKATGASGAAERVRTGMALVGDRFRKLQNEPILIARLSKYGKYEAAREEE